MCKQIITIIGVTLALVPTAGAQDTVSVSCSSWMDNPIVSGQTSIQARHINDLRRCLDLVLEALNRSGTPPPPPPPTNYCINYLGDKTESSTTFSSFWRANCPGLMFPVGLSQFYTFNLSRRSNMKLSVLSETIDHNIDLDRGSVPDQAFELRPAGGPLSMVEEVLDAGPYIIEVARRGVDNRHEFHLTLDVENVPSPGRECADLLQVDFYRDPESPGNPLFDAMFRNNCSYDIYIQMDADLYRDRYPAVHYASPRGGLAIQLSPGESGQVCADAGRYPSGEPCWFTIHAGVLAASSIDEASTLYYTYTSCRNSGPDQPPCPEPEKPVPGVSRSVRIEGI